MKLKQPIPTPDETLDEIDMDAVASVDDFIRELEAKEKDLHITADLTIEVSQSEYDERSAHDSFSDAAAGGASGGSAHSAPQSGLKTRVFELANEVESLNKRIAELRAERNETQEKSDRRLKDFENYKYRMDRERRGAFIDQISNLAKQMLPVLDNLDRAMAAVEKSGGEKSLDFQQFFDGIALVHQQVNEVFAEMGVQRIATVGEPFDPNFHEAVATEERSDMPSGTVSEEMLRGYRIGNRVIRHSMVKVTTGGSKPESAAPAANDLPDLDPPDAGEAELIPA